MRKKTSIFGAGKFSTKSLQKYTGVLQTPVAFLIYCDGTRFFRMVLQLCRISTVNQVEGGRYKQNALETLSNVL